MNCTYCGDLADTLDHVVPHTYVKTEKKRSYSRRVCVPACRECNNVLGNRLFHTVGARAAYLATAYEKRYAKLLNSPDWDSDELEDLGYSMRSLVEATEEEKRAVTYRIAKCGHVSKLSPTIEDVWREVDDLLGAA